MRTRLIVNPVSDKGHTLALLPEIIGTLQQLGIEVELAQTQAPGHAIELAQKAVAAGFERVVAVGGDGTCNEVANGLLLAPQQASLTIMGLIPTGSGNDWACSLGVPLDIAQACAVLKNGSKRVIDVGRVTVDGQPRIFVNSVGLGFDAEVAVDTKCARFLRGFAMYLWSVFRVLMSGRWPYQAQFSFNGKSHQQPITLLTVANGVRAGGGFYLTPNAEIDDGLFDICYAPQLSRLSLLNLLPKTLNGTHIHHRAITMDRSSRVEVLVENGIPGHIDGEILCIDGHRFEFEIIPRALQVWV
ncbi:MAG: diacylglycerol kinase family lipid kinase [Anaerolineae bacterium]|nr:diacylglycerol kinase family lipid kinase [Anaerolineae bacterium]